MAALLIGILFIAFSVFAVVPGLSWGLQWGPEVQAFLKGAIPVILVFAGFIALLIGLAELKDRSAAVKQGAEPDPENQSGD